VHLPKGTPSRISSEVEKAGDAGASKQRKKENNMKYLQPYVRVMLVVPFKEMPGY
jgi:hypothetical protein